MMLLLKTRAETLETVIKHSKHALHSIPNGIKRGDILLIAQTVHTLKKHQKSIRYLMFFDECYEDRDNESDALWGKHWKYIIKGKIQPIEPFDIKDIQVSKKNYASVMTYCFLSAEDEIAVKEYLSKSSAGKVGI